MLPVSIGLGTVLSEKMQDLIDEQMLVPEPERGSGPDKRSIDTATQDDVDEIINKFKSQCLKLTSHTMDSFKKLTMTSKMDPMGYAAELKNSHKR